MSAARPDPKPQRISIQTIVVCALLILMLALLHTAHFHTRSLRNDEIYTVHAARILSISEITQWMANAGVHPAGWRIVAATWVKFTGVTEPVVRYSSTLTTLIALAFIFRLAADLFGARIGLFAVFLFGTLPFAMFFMHEFRPYSMMAMLTAGMQIVFLRWLKRPTFGRALVVVMLGVAGLQTHYFMGYMITAQVIASAICIRWERGQVVRALGLFAAIALSFSAWMLPFLQRIMTAGGKLYALESDANIFSLLHDDMQIVPMVIGDILLLIGLVLPVKMSRQRDPRPVSASLRFGAEGRKLYLVLQPVIAFALAYAANLSVKSITTRNLIILVPPLAILAAYALNNLPRLLTWTLVLIIGATAVANFRSYTKVAPYNEVSHFVQSNYDRDDQFIFTTSYGDSNTLNMLYYLLDRFPAALEKQDFFFVGGLFLIGAYDVPVHHVTDSDPAALTAFQHFLDGTDHIWFVDHHGPEAMAAYGQLAETIAQTTSSSSNSISEGLYQTVLKQFADTLPGRESVGALFGWPFWEILRAQFAVVRMDALPFAFATEHYEVAEYRRLPEDLAEQIRFGDVMSFQGISIPAGTTVAVCQSIMVETWWQALEVPDSYEIELVLADAEGTAYTSTIALANGVPTSQWEADSYYVSVDQLEIPCDSDAGEYALLLNIHHVENGDFLPVDGPSLETSGIHLATLHVE